LWPTPILERLRSRINGSSPNMPVELPVALGARGSAPLRWGAGVKGGLERTHDGQLTRLGTNRCRFTTWGGWSNHALGWAGVTPRLRSHIGLIGVKAHNQVFEPDCNPGLPTSCVNFANRNCPTLRRMGRLFSPRRSLRCARLTENGRPRLGAQRTH